MIEMGGESQYGTPFGMAHFECAAAGSGALAIKDGLDTAYVGWNPESDMGNIEIWEQNMPMVYIGRSIVANSGGAGKYRGGCSFVSTWLINKTDRICGWYTSEHSSRVFDNAGMCGGYPAPTCQKHRAVRNSNIHELAARGEAAGACAPAPIPHSPNSRRAVGGEHDDVGRALHHRAAQGRRHLHPFLQWRRRLSATCWSAIRSKTACGCRERLPHPRSGRAGFRHRAQRGRATAIRSPIIDATGERRADDAQAAPGARRCPVSDWIAAERGRVEKADFAPEVRKMYAQRDASFRRASPRISASSGTSTPDRSSCARSEAMTSYSKEVIRDLVAGQLPWPQTRRIMSAYKDDDRFFKYRRRAAGPRRAGRTRSCCRSAIICSSSRAATSG